jgi:hypothetical protein
VVRDRSALGAPLGVDGPWLAAILGALDSLHELLAERLPADGGHPVPVEEPAAPQRPHRATPVKEPAPAGPPKSDDDGTTPVAEPAPDTAPISDPPPRVGRGASAAAWRAWAEIAGVAVTAAASRDDIIDACVRAGVLNVK